MMSYCRDYFGRFAVPVPDGAGAADARAALTVQAVQLVDTTPDDASRRLVNSLISARLLVSDAPAEGQAVLRLVHERILTSWVRARKIIEEHSRYFRIRRDIEQAWQRWAGNRRRQEYLLRQTPLAEAQEVARTYRGDLRRDLLAFIRSSSRWALWRQSRLALISGMVALISTGFALVALSAARRAAGNFTAARQAADKLVYSIARGLREQKEVRSETLDSIFNVVGDLLRGIEEALKKPEGPVTQTLNAVLDKAQALTAGQSEISQELESLRRSQGTMLYQFAETYHQNENGWGTALNLADDSLKIWEGFMAAGDASAETGVGYAQAQMVLSDLIRKKLEEAHAPAAEFSNVRKHLDPAEGALLPVAGEFNRRADWSRVYSHVLTRLGDLDVKSGDLGAAEARYGRARDTATSPFQNSQLLRPDI
jgi:hypothetical protein